MRMTAFRFISARVQESEAITYFIAYTPSAQFPGLLYIPLLISPGTQFPNFNYHLHKTSFLQLRNSHNKLQLNVNSPTTSLRKMKDYSVGAGVAIIIASSIAIIAPAAAVL